MGAYLNEADVGAVWREAAVAPPIMQWRKAVGRGKGGGMIEIAHGPPLG